MQNKGNNLSSQRRRRPRAGRGDGGKQQQQQARNTSTAANKKKILLLHGNRQTGNILLGRLDKLQKRLLKSGLELELIAPDAPFKVKDDNSNSNSDDDERHLLTWWHRVDNDYQGLDETLALLKQKEWNNEEIVGIMGFSQGARVAHFLALLHHHHDRNGETSCWFSRLQFVIIVAGYDAPLPDHYFPIPPSPSAAVQGSNNKLSIPSLHVWGLQDPLIAPPQSEAVSLQYDMPRTHIHPGKHFVPTKAPDMQAYIDFIQDAMSITNTVNVSAPEPSASRPASDLQNNVGIAAVNREGKTPRVPTAPAPAISVLHVPATSLIPDEETAVMQQEEVQVLEAIFPEISVTSSVKEGVDGERVLEFPIVYEMIVLPAAADDDGGAPQTTTAKNKWPIHPLTLEVRYPSNYPLEAIPHFNLLHDNNSYEFPSHRVDRVMRILQESSQLELGMPSVLSGIYAVKEYLDQAPINDENELINPMKAFAATTGGGGGADKDKEGVPADSTTSGTDQPLIPPSSPETIQTCNLEGLQIAETVLKRPEWNIPTANATTTAHASSNSSQKGGGGSFWNYTIGLVGKPSAGKSTFFNAATAFSRQRGGGGGDDGRADSEWGGASMAAHPFTTINPNIGYCLIPAPLGSCPEDELDNANEYGSTHGRSPDGRRFLPALLKDVAGLVPGAYQGRGRGNQFLNDLTDATVLIHVVDASGTADAQGNKTVTENEASEFTNPLDDLAWVRNELVEWVYSNLTAKWETILRKGRVKIAGMFSGYGQKQAQTQSVLAALEKFLDDAYQRDRALDKIDEFDAGDVHRLVSAFVGVRFPMSLALNKCDLPSSQDYVMEMQGALPIHGAHVGTPMAARQEMMFVRNHLKKTPIDDVKEPGSVPRGVWDCLTSTMMLRQPVVVFPVSDFFSYAPLPGLNKDAAETPSLPSQGMIRCITAAGGSPPTCWNDSQQGYAVPTKDKSTNQKLRDVVLMKPGSTVEDLFFSLKNVGALGGEFVRAEAAANVGEKPKPVPKLEVIGRHNRIIKIMSNRRTAWQS